VSQPVFFLQHAADVSVGSVVQLDGPEGHHAATVRRLRAGERLLLTDGRGAVLDAEVTEVGRREVTCAVVGSRTEDRPTLRLTVVQALPKGDRGELAVELLTEVGVDQIVPWQAERCVSRWKGDKVERGRAKWQAAAAEAAKQSRRVNWPAVAALAESRGVAEAVKGADLALVLHESADQPLAPLLEAGTLPMSGLVMVVVGPEGGISDGELAMFESAGATPVRLGNTVLRTSSAGLAAATLVLARTEPWGSRLGSNGKESM
jgi:16S rRNA (uracil1498-N3)-methyltransferase